MMLNLWISLKCTVAKLGTRNKYEKNVGTVPFHLLVPSCILDGGACAEQVEISVSCNMSVSP